ncbi:MAG: hypothetical protein GY810_04045 [Aureispira sp.]|nr:hypothetical protein [Aureispira sp.]
MTKEEMQKQLGELAKELSEPKLSDLVEYAKMLVEMENSDKAIAEKFGPGFGKANLDDPNIN